MEINGKKVINATKNLEIHIQPKDIDSAKTKDPGACAAALALCREYDCSQARVHLSVTYLEYKPHWVRYVTPDSLGREIVAIDRGGQFFPGTHTLKKIPPSYVAKLAGGKRQGSKTGDRRTKAQRKGKPTKPQHRIEGVRPRGANI